MKIKWLVLGAILVLLIIGAPSSNPLHTEFADAAGYPYQRYAQWQMADPVANGGFFRVRAAVTWNTSDPSTPCYDSNRSTGINGVGQAAAIDYPTIKCGLLGTSPYQSQHEYPSDITGISCWVSSATLYTVEIDTCGYIPSWWNNAPWFYTVGIRFRVCAGLYRTPFYVCDGYVSMLHIGGSEVWVADQKG